MDDENTWKGLIAFVMLFRGSKSESVYPVLDCDNGQSYRVRLIGATTSDTSKYLKAFDGQRVTIRGIADTTRGHRRLSTDKDGVSADCSLSDYSVETSPASPKSVSQAKKKMNGEM